jgi:DNA-binding transcriptional MerR regulator
MPRNVWKQPAPKKPEPQPDVELSSSEVAHIYKVSLRQLQWWDERSVISPRHVGHRRVYDHDQAVIVGVLSELRRKGCSLQVVRKILNTVRREGLKLLLVQPETRPEWRNGIMNIRVLMAPLGKHCYIESDDSGALDLLTGIDGPMYVVSLSDQAARLAMATAPGGGLLSSRRKR